MVSTPDLEHRFADPGCQSRCHASDRQRVCCCRRCHYALHVYRYLEHRFHKHLHIDEVIRQGSIISLLVSIALTNLSLAYIGNPTAPETLVIWKKKSGQLTLTSIFLILVGTVIAISALLSAIS